MAKFEPNKLNSNKSSSKNNYQDNSEKQSKPVQKLTQQQPKPPLNKTRFDLKSLIPKTKKSRIISVCAVALLSVSFLTIRYFTHEDKVKIALEQGQKSGNNTDFTNSADFKAKEGTNKDTSDKTFTDGNEDFFKSNRVFDTVYIADEGSKDLKTGSILYFDKNQKYQTSIAETDVTQPLSNVTYIGTTDLYGFAAVKNDKTNSWIRIPFIQPIPVVEANYESYGGTSKSKVEKEIESRHKTAQQDLDKATKANTDKQLDISKSEQLRKQGKINEAIDSISKQLQDNASKFAKPLAYYYQDSFNLPLTADDMNSIKDSNYMNILDQNYYGLVSKDAVNSLNKVSQKVSTDMISNWGLNVKHSIFVFNDKSYIVIDGIAYKYSNVVLDLYDTPDAHMNDHTNILGTKTAQPNDNKYKTSIMVKNN